MNEEAPEEGSQRQKLNVLIVDDSDFMRTLIAEAVRRCPQLQVAGEARDGDEALELIRTLRPDVVTLDLRMPRMPGLDVLAAMRKESLGPQVIVLSGLMETTDKQSCLQAGATAVFEKTEQFEEFKQALARL